MNIHCSKWFVQFVQIIIIFHNQNALQYLYKSFISGEFSLETLSLLLSIDEANVYKAFTKPELCLLGTKAEAKFLGLSSFSVQS